MVRVDTCGRSNRETASSDARGTLARTRPRRLAGRQSGAVRTGEQETTMPLTGSERGERTETAGTGQEQRRTPTLTLAPCLAQHPLDGVVVDTELGGDGGHPPVLDEVETQDLHLERVVDCHGAPPVIAMRGCAGVPAGSVREDGRTRRPGVHGSGSASCWLTGASTNSPRAPQLDDGRVQLSIGAMRSRDAPNSLGRPLRGTGGSSASGARHDSAGCVASTADDAPPRAAIHPERGRCSALHSTAGPDRSESR